MKIPAVDWLGKPGIFGLGLLLFCLSFYLGNLAPARQELARLNAEAGRLAAARPGEADTAAAQSQRQAPPFASATDALRELSALAEQHGLSVERSAYRLSDQNGQRRLQIDLPLKAAYPTLRSYLHAVLAMPGAPVLDELVLQRQKSTDAQVEANLRLSYYFAPPP